MVKRRRNGAFCGTRIEKERQMRGRVGTEWADDGRRDREGWRLRLGRELVFSWVIKLIGYGSRME